MKRLISLLLLACLLLPAGMAFCEEEETISGTLPLKATVALKSYTGKNYSQMMESKSTRAFVTYGLERDLISELEKRGSPYAASISALDYISFVTGVKGADIGMKSYKNTKIIQVYLVGDGCFARIYFLPDLMKAAFDFYTKPALRSKPELIELAVEMGVRKWEICYQNDHTSLLVAALRYAALPKK